MFNKAHFKRRRPNPELDLVNQMKEMHQFLFVGSRFMAQEYSLMLEDIGGSEEYDFSNTVNSDWDFVIQYSGVSRELLSELGFVQREGNGYSFNPFSPQAFYKHPTYNIEVTMRRDVTTEQSLWESIDPEFFHKYLWKSAPHRSEEGVEEHKRFIADYFSQVRDTIRLSIDNGMEGTQPDEAPVSTPFRYTTTSYVTTEGSF